MSQPLQEFDDLIDEAAEGPIVGDDTAISTVSLYAEQLAAIEKQIGVLNAKLELCSKRKRELAEDLLPTAMGVAGMKSFVTTNGTKIDIVKFTSARIPEAQKGEAFAWLRSNGHGGLIRTEISVDFPRGQETLAAEAESLLNSLGCTVHKDDKVHYKTLEKFIKELHEDGKDVPRNLFGVFVGSRATIKQSPTLS